MSSEEITITSHHILSSINCLVTPLPRYNISHAIRAFDPITYCRFVVERPITIKGVGDKCESLRLSFVTDPFLHSHVAANLLREVTGPLEYLDIRPPV